MKITAGSGQSLWWYALKFKLRHPILYWEAKRDYEEMRMEDVHAMEELMAENKRLRADLYAALKKSQTGGKECICK